MNNIDSLIVELRQDSKLQVSAVEDIGDQFQAEAVYRGVSKQLLCFCSETYWVGKKQTNSTVTISKVRNITHVFLEDNALSQPQQKGKLILK